MSFKFISLNLWEGGLLFDQVVDFIKKQKPDIIALQEVYNAQDPSLPKRFRILDVLRSLLPEHQFRYATEFIDNRPEGRVPQGNAVFSRFPIIKDAATFFIRPLDEHFVDKPENYPNISRNLQELVISLPSGDVHVINFHGVWDLNDDYSEARKKMSRALVKAVQGKKRIILAGDTNAQPTNPAMKEVEKFLISVFGDSLTTTFNMRRKNSPGYATAAVDMIFISNDIKLQSKSVPNIDISDHLPLIVTLEV